MNTKGNPKNGAKKKSEIDNKIHNIKRRTKTGITKDTPLSPKEQAFVNYYIECNSGTEAAKRAGYAPKSANVTASKLLTKPNVAFHIEKIREEMRRDSIATGAEVMEYFTKVMRGEERDQFDLDIPIGERTRAAMELAKRTTDIENRQKGVADNKVEIHIDWKR